MYLHCILITLMFAQIKISFVMYEETRYSGNYMHISLYSEITCSDHVMPLTFLITSVGLTREALKTVTY